MKSKPSGCYNYSSLIFENVSPNTADDDAGKTINVKVNTDDSSFYGESLLEFRKICLYRMGR